MIKFLHASDFHLDAPFAALGREAAVQRRQEQREAVTALVDLCNSAQCDLMLLAGDLLDSDAAYPETVEHLCREFARCSAEIVISPGNHDRYLHGGPYDTAFWPDNVHIFTENRIRAVEFPALDCTVWGAAFTAMDCAPLLEGFSVADPEGINLMVLHGELKPGSNYNPMSEQQIAASGLDYLALGHVHMQSGLLRAGETHYAWPGCLMGRGFDEAGEKGCYLGEVGKDGCRLDFVPLPGRRYEVLHVQAGDNPAAAIEAALPQDASRDIYRIYLEGECDSPDLRALYAQFAPRCFSLNLRDKTLPTVDLWAACGDDSLRGLFLQELKARYDAETDEEERQLIAQAARYGLAATEGRELT